MAGSTIAMLSEPEIEKSLILRFKGKNSYLYGDTQLIYFEEIREYLRSNEDGDLVLELV